MQTQPTCSSEHTAPADPVDIRVAALRLQLQREIEALEATRGEHQQRTRRLAIETAYRPLW